MPDFLSMIQYLSYLLLAMVVVPVFPLLYVLVRWRSGGGHPAGIGTHGALLYFTCVGFLIALSGGANLVYGAFSATPVDEAMRRFSWALLAGGGITMALNVVLMRKFGPLSDPAEVVRIFVGFVMVLTGMVAVGTLVGCFNALFQEAKNPGVEKLRNDAILMYGVWFAFFIGAYLVTARLLAKHAHELNGNGTTYTPPST